MDSSSLALLFLVVVAGVIGAILLIRRHFSGDAVTKRGLRAVQSTPIAEVAEGQVAKVTGVVRSDDKLLTAPFSRRPCVCWEVVVEEYRTQNRSDLWHTIIREQGSQPFVLEDDTGQALVEAATRENTTCDDTGKTVEGAMIPQLALETDARFGSGEDDDAADGLEAVLERHGRTSTSAREMRCREGVLEPGERVGVLGQARWEPDPDPSAAGRRGYRDNPDRLVISACNDGQLLISDDPDVQK